MGAGNGNNQNDIIAMILEDNRRRDVMMAELLRSMSTTTRDTNYNIMPDLSQRFSPYDGTTGAVGARDFLRTLNGMKTRQHWSDDIALEVASMNLTGGARDWYRMYAEEITTFDQFTTKFKNTFIVNESAGQRWEEMQKIIQGKDEDVTKYFYAKAKKCARLDLSFEDTKEQILIGLRSKDVYDAMAAKEHADLTHLYHSIIRDMTTRSQRVQRIKTTTERPTTLTAQRPRGTYASAATQHNTEISTSASREATGQGAVGTKSSPPRPRSLPRFNQEGEAKCYNCNNYGHIAKDCDQPVKPRNCKTCDKRHLPGECDRGSLNINCVMTTAEDTVRKYVKPVKLGDAEVTGLIDPGSAACTVKATAILRYGWEMIKQPLHLRSFGPEEYQVFSPGIIKQDVTVEGVTVKQIPFRVVPDDAQATDVLIGRPFTDHPSVNYHKVGEKLTFELVKEALPTEYVCEEAAKPSQVLMYETKIPPNLVSLIQVRHENEDLTLPVLNIMEKPRSLAAGTILSRCEITTPPRILEKNEREPVTSEDLNVGDETTIDVTQILVKLFNQYRCTVAKSIAEIGCTDLVTMDIKEIPGSKPVRRRPYKASDRERESIRTIVKEWKEQGIVTETNSTYASPVLLVKKKTGEDRLVVDYGPLNGQTERIQFPLPDLDEHLRQIGDATMFITLDLAHGYLQVPLAPEARAKTAFITPDETGEFTRMVFGLMNAPFYFSKVMQIALGDLRDKLVMFYLDDILLPGRNWEELVERLELVLQALKRAGLTINLKKSHFMVQEVEYLGNTISKKGIQPGERKAEAVDRFPVPQDKHEIRRFHGLASYFRKFIPTFAVLAEPLTRLLKKEAIFAWREEQQRAYDTLRQKITSRPILKPYVSSRPTELHTDASATGIGAMLMQEDQDGVLRLVYAISRRTTEPEKNYHSSKMELLAIVWAVSRLRPMLINISFKIISDCQALVFLNAMKTRNAQVARWYATLNDFDYDIEHRAGSKMSHVDALSRAPVGPAEDESVAEERLLGVYSIIDETTEILMYQRTDEDLQRKAMILRTPEKQRTNYEKGEVKEYDLQDGILYKKQNDKLLFVIPRALRKGLLVRFHDLQSHPGLDRTVAKIKECYYFPGMKRYAKQHIHACIDCIVTKQKTGRQPGELHPIPPGHRPFATVHTDHVGPYVTSGRKNKHVLVMVDNLTKFCVLKAVRDTKVVNVVKMLEEFVLIYGAPERIISDRGTCFTAQKFTEVCEKHGIQHVLNSPRHPQANGQVERLNATINPAIQLNLQDQEGRDWDLRIKQIQRDLNTSFNKTTGRTPFEVLYGYVNHHDEGALRQMCHPSTATYQLPQQLQEQVRQTILREQQKTKAQYDRNRLKGVKYEVGEIVFVKKPADPTGESTKLQLKARGPLIITKVLDGDTYRVSDLNSDAQGRRYASTAHVTQIRPWKPHQNEDDNEEVTSEDENDGERATSSSPAKCNEGPRENPIMQSSDAQSKDGTPTRRESGRFRRPPIRLGYPTTQHEDELASRTAEC